MCDPTVPCGNFSFYQFDLMGGKSNSSGTVNLRVQFCLLRLDWLYTIGFGLDEVDIDER